MSSREIAELTGTRHDNVKRTIESIVAKGVIACPQIESVQELGGNNRRYTTQEYRLDKRTSYIVVAQLSPEFTAALVDRWQALEAQQAPALPRTMAEALRLAANQAEAMETQRLRSAYPLDFTGTVHVLPESLWVLLAFERTAHGLKRQLQVLSNLPVRTSIAQHPLHVRLVL